MYFLDGSLYNHIHIIHRYIRVRFYNLADFSYPCPSPKRSLDEIISGRFLGLSFLVIFLLACLLELFSASSSLNSVAFQLPEMLLLK